MMGRRSISNCILLDVGTPVGMMHQWCGHCMWQCLWKHNQKWYTGWPFRLIQASCWQQYKSWVVHGHHTKTELLFGCRREVWINLNGHPVLPIRSDIVTVWWAMSFSYYQLLWLFCVVPSTVAKNSLYLHLLDASWMFHDEPSYAMALSPSLDV